jgi:hypothetical protein
MERNANTAWVYVHEETPFGKDREWKDLIQRINESARRLGVFLVEKDEDSLEVGASDGLIPEEQAIEIIAATLNQVRDLVFAVQSFRSNNISSHSHPTALAPAPAGQRALNAKTQLIRFHLIWTPISKHLFKRMFQRLLKHLSFSTPRTRPQVIVCSGENPAIGVIDMGHPPIMISRHSSLRFFRVPRLIPACSHHRTSP